MFVWGQMYFMSPNKQCQNANPDDTLISIFLHSLIKAPNNNIQATK